MPANFEIAYPWIFLLLPLPILVYWLLPPLRMRSASLSYPGFEKALEYTGEMPRKAALIKKRKIIQWTTLLLCWVLILCALSSPRLIGEPKMQVVTSRNFLVLADISFSMAQTDWKINDQKARRWEAVKEVMHDFIDKRQGDRLGLIFFGSEAYIQAPFTPDLSTIDQMLEEADVGMAGQMTHIGKAIAKGKEMFDRDTIETKVMLLLTDGVDAGTNIMPLDAAEMAKSDSINIYTIGIGDPATRGADLDERTLKEIAELTGGKYFLAKNTEELEKIYSEIDKLEPIEFEEMDNQPAKLLYFYPLSAAIILLVFVNLILTITTAIQKRLKRRTAYV